MNDDETKQRKRQHAVAYRLLALAMVSYVLVAWFAGWLPG
jgi:hypothetical protein